MNPDKASIRLMVRTLHEAGVTNVDLKDIRILGYAPPDSAENKKVYEKTNQTLLSILRKRNVGECIHITGEGRALADPRHRRVCRTAWERYHNPFRIVCHLPPTCEASGRGIMQFKMREWGRASWMHCLDIFDMLGSGAVSFLALEKLEKVHYSLFANELVLLQSKHRHSREKHVWLLESTDLHGSLMPLAKDVVSRAKHIPSRVFDEQMLSTSSPIALHLLSVLEQKGRCSKRRAHAEVNKIGFRDRDYVADLKATGFIAEVNGSISITGTGREYLGLYDEQ